MKEITRPPDAGTLRFVWRTPEIIGWSNTGR